MMGDGGSSLSFATDVYTIMTGQGGCTACHIPNYSAGAPAGGLDLMTGGAAGAMAALVNKNPYPGVAGGACAVATLPSGTKLVVPGMSDLSLLYHKVASAIMSTPVLCGVSMPQGGALTMAEVATIKAWIDDGANP
jgi:hypothetical protein